jgi:hypothetical protein
MISRRIPREADIAEENRRLILIAICRASDCIEFCFQLDLLSYLPAEACPAYRVVFSLPIPHDNSPSYNVLLTLAKALLGARILKSNDTAKSSEA